nr:MAG TPA: hypothetical protein [Microviridae sp.]
MLLLFRFSGLFFLLRRSCKLQTLMHGLRKLLQTNIPRWRSLSPRSVPMLRGMAPRSVPMLRGMAPSLVMLVLSMLLILIVMRPIRILPIRIISTALFVRWLKVLPVLILQSLLLPVSLLPLRAGFIRQRIRVQSLLLLLVVSISLVRIIRDKKIESVEALPRRFYFVTKRERGERIDMYQRAPASEHSPITLLM